MRGSLSRGLTLLLLLVVGGVGLWLLPHALGWLLRLPGTTDPGAAWVDDGPASVDVFVESTLEEMGLGSPAASSESAGLRRRVYRLSGGHRPLDVARQIREAAAAEGLEVYASPVDGLDVELRVYAGPSLRYHIILVPELSPSPVVPPEPILRMRPQLAIVVVGLGHADASNLTRLPIPLSLGIEAFSPFALRIAWEATRSWHEVLVQLPVAQPGDNGPSVGEAFRAVPFASGVVGRSPPAADEGLPDFSVFVLNGREAPRAPSGARYALLAAQGSARLGALRALLRARHLSLRAGVATVILDARDPEIVDALGWALKADRDGYRLILASEAARSAEVHGISPEATPVAAPRERQRFDGTATGAPGAEVGGGEGR